jgi:hypothetical protein
MKQFNKILSILIIMSICILPLPVGAIDIKLSTTNNTEILGKIESIYPSYNNKGQPDGYLFFSNGNSELIKHDLSENEVYYIKNGDATTGIDVDVIWNGDSKYEVKGYTDLLITAVDSTTGKTIFERQYGGSGNEWVDRAFKSYDDSGKHDGYYILLYTESSDTSTGYGDVLIKYDLKGNLVFEKNITNFRNDLYTYEFGDEPWSGLLYIKNGKYDSTFSYDEDDSIIYRYNDDEDLFEIETDYVVNKMNLSYTATGEVDGIVVIGTDYEKEYFAKYDLSGKEVFKKTVSGYEQFTIKSSHLPNGTYDGYIASALDTETFGSAILKYDLQGNLMMDTVYDEDETYFVNYSLSSYDENGNENGIILISRGADGIAQLNFVYNVYEVAKDTTEEGEIAVNTASAIHGEVVSVSVTPKEGYVLKRIVVMDESGKEIEVTDDGTFIMPEGKVTVTAIYKKITNPETVSACYVVLGIILLISIGTLIVNKQKAVKNN